MLYQKILSFWICNNFLTCVFWKFLLPVHKFLKSGCAKIKRWQSVFKLWFYIFCAMGTGVLYSKRRHFTFRKVTFGKPEGCLLCGDRSCFYHKKLRFHETEIVSCYVLSVFFILWMTCFPCPVFLFWRFFQTFSIWQFVMSWREFVDTLYGRL